MHTHTTHTSCVHTPQTHHTWCRRFAIVRTCCALILVCSLCVTCLCVSCVRVSSVCVCVYVCGGGGCSQFCENFAVPPVLGSTSWLKQHQVVDPGVSYVFQCVAVCCSVLQCVAAPICECRGVPLSPSSYTCVHTRTHPHTYAHMLDVPATSAASFRLSVSLYLSVCLYLSACVYLSAYLSVRLV